MSDDYVNKIAHSVVARVEAIRVRWEQAVRQAEDVVDHVHDRAEDEELEDTVTPWCSCVDPSMDALEEMRAAEECINAALSSAVKAAQAVRRATEVKHD